MTPKPKSVLGVAAVYAGAVYLNTNVNTNPNNWFNPVLILICLLLGTGLGLAYYFYSKKYR
ncbi:hypothetical protein BVJ53_08130 [Lacticaseibacillus chiayiensis]|uniref:Uncharacterized protein n=1 Tax=Lacticaseibacillus chiayiensis TaxID=2100821 RepID=A0A4Q1TUU7_9LACO|nr:hypothetical protein BVJ53_08130 [Lacticaseibacillus chiayiensis]RXT56773.1 hypothetical protein CHT97_10995 [Lacticaseibacillus chiayiensis]